MRTSIILCLMCVSAPALCLAADDAVFSPADVTSELQEQGYSAISNLTQSGELYTADATRWGRAETGLVIEATTGNVTNAPKLTTAQVQALLAEKGYTDVANLTEHASEFTATATHDGERVGWKIDATTGAVYLATE